MKNLLLATQFLAPIAAFLGVFLSFGSISSSEQLSHVTSAAILFALAAFFLIFGIRRIVGRMPAK